MLAMAKECRLSASGMLFAHLSLPCDWAGKISLSKYISQAKRSKPLPETETGATVTSELS